MAYQRSCPSRRACHMSARGHLRHAAIGKSIRAIVPGLKAPPAALGRWKRGGFDRPNLADNPRHEGDQRGTVHGGVQLVTRLPRQDDVPRPSSPHSGDQLSGEGLKLCRKVASSQARLRHLASVSSEHARTGSAASSIRWRSCIPSTGHKATRHGSPSPPDGVTVREGEGPARAATCR